MRKTGGDPYWIEARFAGKCHGDKGACQQMITRGDRVFYYPNGRHVFAVPCGHAGENAADFESHRFDDAMMSGEGY